MVRHTLKFCSICCKIFKVCLTILGYYVVKRLKLKFSAIFGKPQVLIAYGHFELDLMDTAEQHSETAIRSQHILI